jgi:hypothetical protein
MFQTERQKKKKEFKIRIKSRFVSRIHQSLGGVFLLK